MDILLSILALAIPGLIALFLHRKDAAADKLAAYHKKTVARRAYSAQRQSAVRGEVVQLEAELVETKTTTSLQTKEEAARVKEAAMQSGAAKAAVEHLRRLPIFILLTAFGASSVRAEPCTDGYTLQAGETLPCDAECLPEPSLMKLVSRSTSLTECEANATATTTTHAKITEALRKDIDLAFQAVLQSEADCLDVIQPDGASTGTVVLVAVVSIVVGALGGVLLYTQLAR